ncbi:Nicotinate phosphoribosyltransferase [Acropora cervicornis]|uniref:Nicotinate phosphoribosyltransferase n=1 Tax=Acropora cervicornis TaxID=6130 RepID=A0AAD9QEI8_ACRCE|nr:Nicotinate phosphoribosyltransferase [Acropora cervicornis]
MAAVEERMNSNPLVQPLLTDFYQITMAYAYWKSGKVLDNAVFDLFFRRNPFQGEFTVFAGLEECVHFVRNFHYSDSDISYLKTVMPSTVDEEFFTFLRGIDGSQVTLSALREGSLVFPRVPLMRLEGPLPVIQLMETSLLNLVNFASLVATNAARFRLAAGWDKGLIEFGLRRSQGPDGGLSASKYCYIGGFDATSNVLAGKLCGIPVKGTQAHAFITSFTPDEFPHVGKLQPVDKSQEPRDFYPVVCNWLKKVTPVLRVLESEVHLGELTAFSAYAVAFPNQFLALVDTYDVISAGSQDRFGRFSLSIKTYQAMPVKGSRCGHEIDTFGIGTHLVTCQKQPALGCVFKLVELNGDARMKLSQDIEKVTIPGKKEAFRLYGGDGRALLDLMQRCDDTPPSPGKRVLCRHPFDEAKRAYVCPSHVETLYHVYWKNGKICSPLPSLKEIQEHVKSSLTLFRQDHMRGLNPTPYKVSLSDNLYTFMHRLWLNHAPIGELF